MFLHRTATRLKELLLQNRNMRQTVVKNFFWLSFGQITGRFIRAAIIIYAARILGATEYGVFSYALSLAAFFATFSDIGVNSILTREISQKPEKETNYFATIFWIKIFLVLVSALAIVFIAPFFAKIEGAKILMPFIALLVIFDNMRDFSLAFFRGKEKMEREAFVTILTNSLITVSGFIILYYFATAKALTATYVISSGLGLFIALLILRNHISKIISHFEKSLIKPIMNSALPIAILATFGTLMITVDVLILGWFGNAKDVGLYAAPQKIVQFLSIFPGILASSFFPAISKLVGKNENEKLKLIVEKATKVMFAAAFPIAIGGIVLSQSIISFVFGNDYLASSLTFQILIATVLTSFPSPLLSNLILAYDKQKNMVWYTISFALLNVLLDIVLIKFYGIAGAAFATLLTTVLLAVAMWRVIRKTHDFHFFHRLKKIIMSAILMGLVAFFLDKIGVQVILNIVLSAGIYGLLLYVLKEEVLDELGLIAKSAKF